MLSTEKKASTKAEIFTECEDGIKYTSKTTDAVSTML